jgi:hypothetical protein
MCLNTAPWVLIVEWRYGSMYWPLYTLNCIPLDAGFTEESVWSLRRTISFPVVFFWVIPRNLNFMCRRFGTLCLFHLHRWCKQEENFFSYQDRTPDPTLTNIQLTVQRV